MNKDIENTDNIEESFPTKDEFGSLNRKRRAMKIAGNRLIRMSDSYRRKGGSYPVDENGERCERTEAIRYKRFWRAKMSKQVKKRCHRRFRRSGKLNMLSGSQKSLNRKATEFWWEFD